MKTYKFSVLEQWMREGYVRANSEEEAKEKILNDDDSIFWDEATFLQNMIDLPDYIEFAEEQPKEDEDEQSG